VRRKNWALLPSLLLLPVLLSGCSVLDTLTGSSSGSSSSSGQATPGPSATPWIVSARGSATPSPAPSYPTGTPTTYATGFLPLPSATAAYPTPSATCTPATYNFASINALTVATTTTSGTATWYNIGGYNLVQFRMTAISQDVVTGNQRDVGWVTMTPTAPCGQVSMTIKGLDRKTHYVFSVDAVVVRRFGDGTHAATVFRSSPILTK
jgi:hypothetical protein